MLPEGVAPEEELRKLLQFFLSPLTFHCLNLLPEEEAKRLEELRKQALTDYEREVSQHAAKLEEMRELRTKLSETEERSRQAEAAAEEVRLILSKD